MMAGAVTFTQRAAWGRGYGTALALAFVVAAGTVWLRAGRNTPESVFAGTLSALETQDVQRLMALADPEELRALNLTPRAVRAVLAETLWSRGYAGPHRSSVVRRTSVDAVVYAARGVPASGKPNDTPLQVSVVDDPKAGWRLNLSALLYFACYRHTGGSLTEGTALWRSMKERHDIWGIRQPADGTYTVRKRPVPPTDTSRTQERQRRACVTDGRAWGRAASS